MSKLGRIGRVQFAKLQKESRRIKGSAHFDLSVTHSDISSKDSILSVVVPGKYVRKATTRNLIKRHVREVIHEKVGQLHKGLAIIIYAKKGVDALSREEIRSECNSINLI